MSQHSSLVFRRPSKDLMTDLDSDKQRPPGELLLSLTELFDPLCANSNGGITPITKSQSWRSAPFKKEVQTIAFAGRIWVIQTVDGRCFGPFVLDWREFGRGGGECG